MRLRSFSNILPVACHPDWKVHVPGSHFTDTNKSSVERPLIDAVYKHGRTIYLDYLEVSKIQRKTRSQSSVAVHVSVVSISTAPVKKNPRFR